MAERIYAAALAHLQAQYNPEAIAAQYAELLDADAPYALRCSAAHAGPNTAKNRYRDVVPYDHNRVLLPAPDHAGGGARCTVEAACSCQHGNTCDCCYINASWMWDPFHQQQQQQEEVGPGREPAASAANTPGCLPPDLLLQPGQGGSIPGAVHPAGMSQQRGGTHIATQGPLPNTVSDLWRMVAASGVGAVVMLTDLEDSSCVLGARRPRCAAYFPDAEQQVLRLPAGPSICCTQRTGLAEGLMLRQLEVDWSSGSSSSSGGGGECTLPSSTVTAVPSPGSASVCVAERAAPRLRSHCSVSHFQYLAWPDYGVPPSSAPVLALCRALDGCRHAGASIMVHCSAGVGRTGTFIVIDMLLQRLAALARRPLSTVSDTDVCAAVDIAGLVSALRTQRRGTVQTAEQYNFVWTAVMDELVALLGQQHATAAASAAQVEAVAVDAVVQQA